MRRIEEYSRWTTHIMHSWSYHIFNMYESHIARMHMSCDSAIKYTYHNAFGPDEVKLTDDAFDVLKVGRTKGMTLKMWSDNLDEYENLARLNRLMNMVSYFETYLDSVLGLAIESDPGIITNTPHSVDGIKLLKDGIKIKAVNTKVIIKQCTQGCWSKRISSMRKLLGELPPSLENSIGELEKIRLLRNKVAHAFGRNIKEARNYVYSDIPRIERLSEKRFLHCHDLLKKIAHDLDQQIMRKHIGHFQILYYYHTMKKQALMNDLFANKVERLKTTLTIKENDGNYSKSLCRWAITYYEHL